MRAHRALLLAVAVIAAGCGELFSRGPGEKIWRSRCAECHGLDAAGNTPRFMSNAYADLTDERWKSHGGDRAGLETAIREGSFPDMPAFDELSGAEMRALLDHIARLRGETP